jgi:hypothetical protein
MDIGGRPVVEIAPMSGKYEYVMVARPKRIRLRSRKFRVRVSLVEVRNFSVDVRGRRRYGGIRIVLPVNAEVV